MVIIRGNSTKSRVYLDVDFDTLEIVHTLTQKPTTLSEVSTTNRGGLYYQALLDFTGLEVGEYKYTAKLGSKVVQTGLLIIEPFDESEEPVQVVTPNLTRNIITYQN